MSESSTSKAIDWIILIILLIIGVSLIPTVVSIVTTAHYTHEIELKVVTPSTANTTTVTYDMLNGSASYFSCVLNQTDKNGNTAETYITDFKDTAVKTIVFYALNNTYTGQKYAITFGYYTLEAWSFTGADAAATLLQLLPFIFIVGLVIFFLIRLLRN